MITTSITQAAEYIEQADALIIAAGAGMGVDSGLPDFRGNEGFWKAYPALAQAKMDFAQAASPGTFVRDAKLAWGFYGHRLALYRNTVPHEGFAILKRWGESKAKGYSVFTSNVDGQFQRAGFAADNIYECHGSIHYLQCLEPCSASIWGADAFTPEIDNEKCKLMNNPPLCPYCNRIARPNILMFGDWSWISDRSDQQAEQLQLWLQRCKNPVVIELGAGTHIPSVRRFSEQIVKNHNGKLIRINPRDYAVPTSNAIGIACGAKEGLLAIDQVISAYQ